MISAFFYAEMHRNEATESEMYYDFWPARHPAALLTLVATAILLFAWPLENVPGCVLAAVMIVVAASITIRAHFRSARMG
jgi:MFS superfamily sulfate permease-like transporter